MRAPFWFVVAAIGSIPFFWLGYASLLEAWAKPEYSYGPLVPLITAYMALREYKHQPIVHDNGSRFPGYLVLALGLLLALLGNVSEIPDFVTYGFIFVIGAVILIMAGTREGLRFWPGWLHLFFMLPLPTVLYWQTSTALQFVSSQIGVGVIKLTGIPVLLDGNIIDLGVYQLLVAEACSGLRYLFPLLSFGWLFAVLYTGPNWHRVILFLSTIPITVLMNSFRIAMIGILVRNFGISHAEGFLHVFEGWIIFVSCIVVLYAEAWLLSKFLSGKRESNAILDIDYRGIVQPLRMLGAVPASVSLIVATTLVASTGLIWQLQRAPETREIDRMPFNGFPLELSTWKGQLEYIDESVERVLGADDYFIATYSNGDSQVNLLLTYYDKQTGGSGIHSPEVCLPGGGWEVSRWSSQLVQLSGAEAPTRVNRAIIQKGLNRQLVYYWFEQRGHRLTNDYHAKMLAIWDKVNSGRSDGGLVRLITPINETEGVEAADKRLILMMKDIDPLLPDFFPALGESGVNLGASSSR